MKALAAKFIDPILNRLLALLGLTLIVPLYLLVMLLNLEWVSPTEDLKNIWHLLVTGKPKGTWQ